MKNACRHIAQSESGAAIIEMVMIVPVILVVVAGLVDLSLLVRSELALDSAATAAVRLCMDNPDLAEDEAAVAEYLREADPSVGDALVCIETDSEDVEAYTYHFYTNAKGECAKRENTLRTSMPVTVELSLTRPFFTPIGRGISLATGGDGTMSLAARQCGVIDTTRGGLW